MNDYLTTSQVTAILNVTTGWLYAQFTQRVIEDIRDNKVKGAPYLYGLRELTELFVSRDCRKLGLGYDVIREVVDMMRDGRYIYVSDKATNITLKINIMAYRRHAREYFRRQLKVA